MTTRGTGAPEAAMLAALAELQVHDASPLIEAGMPMFVVYDGPEITPLLSHDEIGVAANPSFAVGAHRHTRRRSLPLRPPRHDRRPPRG